jgi:hypothetical protein
MTLQIATALAIGAYVVLSKDAQPKRPDATPRESFQRPADHLLDRPTDSPTVQVEDLQASVVTHAVAQTRRRSNVESPSFGCLSGEQWHRLYFEPSLYEKDELVRYGDRHPSRCPEICG